MATKRTSAPASAESGAGLIELLRAIAAGDSARAVRLLAASPAWATAPSPVGASATSAKDYFLTSIQHYLYAGDTALHIAAASFDAGLTAHLLELGASHAARNRRGAEPLHYASDANRDAGAAQAQTIACLCAAGADPNARDDSRVAPLHRAVRTRGAAAVGALLAAGADAQARSGSGSTPLHLAVQSTGRGGSGTAPSVARQKQIIAALLDHGADPAATDGRGKSVIAAARSPWMRELLVGAPARR